VPLSMRRPFPNTIALRVLASHQSQIVCDQEHRRAGVGASSTISSITSRWLSVSSAVVGSSAISSFGCSNSTDGQHDPLSHAARELVGVGFQAVQRVADPDPSSIATARRRISAPGSCRCSRIPSASCPLDGDRRIQGDHRLLKHHPICAPRTLRNSSGLNCVRSRPSNSIRPADCRTPGGRDPGLRGQPGSCHSRTPDERHQLAGSDLEDSSSTKCVARTATVPRSRCARPRISATAPTRGHS